MNKNRLEAFSDGVIAVIITIMVLEMKAPHPFTLAALAQLLPVFVSYVASFIVVAIVWSNHHHMLHVARSATGRVLWLNNHLLFWLSLVPFTTASVGENHLAALPVALYGINMAAVGTAYELLRREISGQHAADDMVRVFMERAAPKNLMGIALYALTAPLAFVSVWLSIAIFLAVPLLYFMPGRNIERLSS